MNNPALPSLYRRTVLEHPLAVIILLALTLAFFALQAQHFRLDASADSLMLEDDKDLQLYRQAQDRYHSQDLLVVTYTPDADLFEDEPLAALKSLRDKLKTISSVDSVFSLLEVPLLTSSGISLSQLTENVPTIETHPEIDRQKIKTEIIQSPVFGELVLSADGGTTALLLSLTDDPELDTLYKQRSALRLQQLQGGLDADQTMALADLNEVYDTARAKFDGQRHDDIAAIRGILAGYKDKAQLHLGGVPMVSDDMISYIARDLVTFGIGVLLFIVLILALIFRRLRWVALPIASCFFAGAVMIGLLGLMGWKVTVISSNFISLMLILTMSMNMHLIVRYRQLRIDQSSDSHVDQVWHTTRRHVLAVFVYVTNNHNRL